MKGVLRPKRTVLPASAQIPSRNVRRRPARYTHELVAEQPYFYEPDSSGEPAGTFAAGTRLEQVAEEGALRRVVDSRGLSVYTSSDGLEALPKPRARARKR